MSENTNTEKPKLVRPAAGERGMTQLHYAAYCNDPVGVRKHLAAGEKVDVRDANDWTPLHWLIDMSQAGGEPEAVVALLLEAGAPPNAVNKDGASPLMFACGRNSMAILELLLASGADVHLRNQASSPLHEAAWCNFSEGVVTLLRRGADPAQLDGSGQTPEQIARDNEFQETIAVFEAARPTNNRP